ncbi:hypothetical protein J6590_023639 [Homalodisca vitripennis]|nr:hypothetical protein J6590_023639 [Homalodisca vitripennis]
MAIRILYVLGVLLMLNPCFGCPAGKVCDVHNTSLVDPHENLIEETAVEKVYLPPELPSVALSSLTPQLVFLPFLCFSVALLRIRVRYW